MILYSRNVSNYCFKTEWALYELGILFKRELNQGDHDVEGMAKVAAVTPILTTIPTLIDEDGFVLTESSVIIQYLVDSRKIDSPFFPRDPKTRARILQWDRFCDFEVAKTLGAFYYNSPDYLKGTEINHGDVEAARKMLPLIEQKLEDTLLKQKYIISDSHFTYADAALATNLFFLQWFNFKMSKPAVSRWLNDCTSRPEFQKRLSLTK